MVTADVHRLIHAIRTEAIGHYKNLINPNVKQLAKINKLRMLLEVDRIMETEYNFTDFDRQEKEAKSLQQDIHKAKTIVSEGMAQYKKQKLHAKSKKQSEDMSLLFAPLDGYNSEREIQDAYGYDRFHWRNMTIFWNYGNSEKTSSIKTASLRSGFI